LAQVRWHFPTLQIFQLSKLKRHIDRKHKSRRPRRGQIQSLQDGCCRILGGDPANAGHVLAAVAAETGRARRLEFQDAGAIIGGRKQFWLVDAGMMTVEGIRNAAATWLVEESGTSHR